MNNSTTTPFGGGEDRSLLSSVWDYLTTSTKASAASESSSIPNEETHLLPTNERQRITTTTTTTAATTGHTMMNQDTVIVDESTLSIKSSLQELDREIHRLDNNKFAYYVATESLKLAMLRAERFEVKPAALRIMIFCEAQQHLFGVQSLGRHLQSTKDLSLYEQQILQSGCIQVLPPSTTNTTGNRWHRRTSPTIVCYFPKYLPPPPPCDDDDDDDDATIKSIMKVWWYIALHRLLRDEHHVQTQRLGVIGILYQVGHDTLTLSELNFQRTLWWHFMCSIKQLPMRFVGYHYCFDNYKVRQAIYLYTNYYSKYYVEEEQHQQQQQQQNSPCCRFHDGTLFHRRFILRGQTMYRLGS
jgi:hypothetical protein